MVLDEKEKKKKEELYDIEISILFMKYDLLGSAML